MAVTTMPAQKQEHQPGIEREMRPLPDYEPKYPGVGKLKGKVALITGGDSGIGRAVAVAMAREGAQIAIVYLNEHKDANETRGAVKSEGSEAILLAGDVGDESFCEAAVDAAVEQFGRIDILVNNAGEQHETEDVREIDAQQIERTFRTNVFSFFFMAKHALRHMGKGATIINTTSVTAYQGHKTLLDYSATKGAIVAMTRSLAEALSKDGIRVNAVAPGPIWTPLIPASFEPERVAKHGSSVPMERPGQPNEVAPCYVFLASEEASYISGQVLHPNGGNIVGS
ncbi:MAG TPA: SDR family oxidoreductase [Pseudolabrys sp.]|jgi:NAD(P)-dependent dehydrogenase (short-subunit alcohol dehydrogenase family)